MHAEVTPPNTLNSCLSNFVMAESTSRFATLSAEDLDLLLYDKDVNWKFFINIWKKKKADEPQTKETLANVLKLFYAEVRKVDGTQFLFKEHIEHLLRYMHNKTIIGFGFRMIARTIKASVCVIRLSLRLRQITQTSALIILAIMLNLIQ